MDSTLKLVKRPLDVSLRPQDVADTLGALHFEILALRRKCAVLEARVDELESGLADPPKEIQARAAIPNQ